MKHTHQKILLLTFVIVFGVIGFLNRGADFAEAQPQIQLQQQQQQQQILFTQVADWDLQGWAFSSNTGWISLHCDNMGTCGDVDYRVSLNYPASDLTGKGWSSWIGWVDFDPGGTPPDNGTPGVFLDFPTGKMSGWARATSALHAQAGGWDGWIKIRGNVLDDAGLYEYGVEQNWTAPTPGQNLQIQQQQGQQLTPPPSTPPPSIPPDGGNGGNVERFRLFGEKAHAQGNGDPFEGYGWGNEVIGWLLFDATLRVPPPQVSITANGADYSIVIADFDLGGETATLDWTTTDVDLNVMCQATTPTGSGGWDAQNPDPQGGSPYTTSSLFGSPPPGTPHTFNIECTGLDGSSVSDSVSVTILEPFTCVNSPYTNVFIGDFVGEANDTESQGLLVLPGDYCFSPTDMCINNSINGTDYTLQGWIDLEEGRYIDVDGNGDPICYLVGGVDPSSNCFYGCGVVHCKRRGVFHSR